MEAHMGISKGKANEEEEEPTDAPQEGAGEKKFDSKGLFYKSIKLETMN
jgi:hypothetical protein